MGHHLPRHGIVQIEPAGVEAAVHEQHLTRDDDRTPRRQAFIVRPRRRVMHGVDHEPVACSPAGHLQLRVGERAAQRRTHDEAHRGPVLCPHRRVMPSVVLPRARHRRRQPPQGQADGCTFEQTVLRFVHEQPRRMAQGLGRQPASASPRDAVDQVVQRISRLQQYIRNELSLRHPRVKTSYELACMPDQGRNDAAGGIEKQANHIPFEQP